MSIQGFVYAFPLNSLNLCTFLLLIHDLRGYVFMTSTQDDQFCDPHIQKNEQ